MFNLNSWHGKTVSDQYFGPGKVMFGYVSLHWSYIWKSMYIFLKLCMHWNTICQHIWKPFAVKIKQNFSAVQEQKTKIDLRSKKCKVLFFGKSFVASSFGTFLFNMLLSYGIYLHIWTRIVTSYELKIGSIVQLQEVPS